MLNAITARVMGSLRLEEGTIPALLFRVMLPHERYRNGMRQHPAVLAGSLLLVVGWLLGTIIADQFLPTNKNSSSVALITWLIWLAICIRFLIHVYGWSASYLFFSDLRLFIVSGVVIRRVQGIPLSTISDVSFSKSPIGRLFGYGKFTFEIGGADRILVPFDYIPNPEEVLIEMLAMIFPDEGATAELPPGKEN